MWKLSQFSARLGWVGPWSLAEEIVVGVLIVSVELEVVTAVVVSAALEVAVVFIA